MGPPPFSDGNLARVLAILRRGPPSMGPPPFGDGNLIWGSTTSKTSSLQWRHRLSAMETSPHCGWASGGLRPSMGPPPFGDGNRLEPAECKGERPPPSMGPPPFGDGNQQEHPENRGGLQPPSMGPPPFGDGNLKRRRDAPASLVGPSMGPPPFGDGNLDSITTAFTEAVSLQWGHRLSAMETKPKPRWDVHFPGDGNRCGSLAGVLRALIAGPSGSAVSPRLSGWTARQGICRPAPAPPPCCPSTDCQWPPLSPSPR